MGKHPTPRGEKFRKFWRGEYFLEKFLREDKLFALEGSDITYNYWPFKGRNILLKIVPLEWGSPKKVSGISLSSLYTCPHKNRFISAYFELTRMLVALRATHARRHCAFGVPRGDLEATSRRPRHTSQIEGMAQMNFLWKTVATSDLDSPWALRNTPVLSM